nr:MAG TPA: hypothetical protein [Caudoviricetes sp.]
MITIKANVPAADYAEAHPWRNLWAWVKRKVARHE